MKIVNQFLFFFGIAIPVLVLILNIVDITNLYQRNSNYPFGSEFFSSYSIYSSKSTYIVYLAVLSILAILMIIYAYKKRWITYSILFAISATLFLYPLLAND